MAWSAVHLFVALYLCTYTTNAAKHGTLMSPLLTTTKSLSATDELLESLIRKINEQEIRLQRLEKTVSENVEALRNKDILIEGLMGRVQSMETRLGISQTVHSVSDNQPRPSETVATELRENRTTINVIRSAGVQNHRDRIARQQSTQQKQDEETNPRKWSNRVGPAVSHTNVAFSVTLRSDTDLQGHETIVYNNVILDNTNMFNPQTGVFTVPESGVYVFTWSCTAGLSGGGFVHTSLRIDGVSRYVTQADSPNAYLESSTGLIVTSVNQGVGVYIRAERAGHILNNQYAVASFSGWRLF